MSNALNLTIPEGTPFIDGERWLDAPVAHVWRALTEPDLVARWSGPSRLTTEIGTWEVRDGGAWSYVQREADGTGYAFRGVIHSAVPERSVTQTFEFLGVPGHVSLEHMDLEDHGARTRLVMHVVYQSVEDRDAVVASGMEGGMAESYDRLEALLGGS